jgi:hypothetical protein
MENHGAILLFPIKLGLRRSRLVEEASPARHSYRQRLQTMKAREAIKQEEVHIGVS